MRDSILKLLWPHFAVTSLYDSSGSTVENHIRTRHCSCPGRDSSWAHPEYKLDALLFKSIFLHIDCRILKRFEVVTMEQTGGDVMVLLTLWCKR
jgi:hypothetical protein